MSKEIISCPVCSQPLGANKMPRVFPQCKHTLCEECLLNILNKDTSEGFILCPVDNEKIELEQKSLASFPKNFSLLKMEKRNSTLSAVKSRTSLFSSEGIKEESSNVLGESNKSIKNEDTKEKAKQKEQNKLQIQKLNTKTQQQKKRQSILMLVKDRILNCTKAEPMLLSKRGSDQDLMIAQESQNEFLQQKQMQLHKKMSKQKLQRIISEIQQDKNKININDFQLDNVLQTLQPTSKMNVNNIQIFSKEDICLAHDKPLDVICIKCQKIVCSACALFADHKGHDIKSISDVKKDILQRQKSILTLLQQKQIIQKSVQSSLSSQSLLQLICVKKDKICKQIQDHVQSTIEKLLQQQKKYLLQLDRQSQQLLKSLKKQVQPIEDKLQQIKNCQNRSLEILEILESDISLQKKIAYINYDKKVDFIDKISTSINEIKDMKGKAMEKNISILNKMNIKFKSLDMKGLVSFCKERSSLQIAYEPILNQVKKQKRAIEENGNEELLIDLKGQQHGVSIIMNQSMTLDVSNTLSSLPVDNSMMFRTRTEASFQKTTKKPSNILGNTIKSVSKNKLPVSPASKITTRNLRSLSKVSSTSNFSKSKTKLVKIKLPERIQKIYNSLVTDSLSILDLTFAQLGNESVSFILQQLGDKKVKIIKLVRNKLTDDILKYLWINMKNIQSLNLSQNNFSDKIIESFMQNFPKLSSLKSITLSQNKINARAMKPEIDEIKKWNITLSL